MIVSFVVPGKPKGKGRPRFARRGKFVSTYTPNSTKEYENHVLQCWKEQSGEVFEEVSPLCVDIKGYFPIPKGTSKKKREYMVGKPHTHKPDTDNLAKGILDAVSGTVFHDDSEIVKLTVSKNYCDNEGFVEVSLYNYNDHNGRVTDAIYLYPNKKNELGEDSNGLYQCSTR